MLFLPMRLLIAYQSYTLETNETVVLEVNYQQDFDYVINIISNKFYNSVNVSPIIANTAIDYSFNDITPASSGFAYLRMNIGREHIINLNNLRCH